jgi:hypothetical protein
MRVTIAVVACLAALVRADTASAHAAAESSRAVAAAICAEPARVVEVVLPGEAIGGERVTAAPAAPATDEGGTLWCVSPDDPRCQPLDASGHDGMSIASAKLSYTAGDGLEGPTPRELAAVSGETSHHGSARDGFLGRLERPPNRRAA